MNVGAVLRRFGVDEGARVRRIPRGAVNDLWRVDVDSAGSFVLKRTHPERLHEHVEREHVVLRFLADAGWSVPSPLPTDDGSTTVRIEDRTWWMAPWLPGRQPAITEPAVHRLGALLARLHVTLDPLADLPAVDHPLGVRGLWQREVKRHGWRFIDGLRDLERVDPARGGRLRREVDRVTDALGSLAAGPTVVGHGDLHPGNLLVHRGVTSVLDFDFNAPMERAADVAMSVCLLDDPRLHPAVVAGYESVSPLDDEERAALPVLFDARLLSHATWVTFLCSRGEAGPAELDITFERLGTYGVGAC